LGIMGDGMTRRLLQSGRRLVVWNRSVEKSERLQSEYGTEAVVVASSAREVVESCELTYAMLSDQPASEAVYHDPAEGILKGLAEAQAAGLGSRRLVDAATLSEEHMQGLAHEVSKRGATFLEAPVSGSKGPAATGQLVFLCGGDKELFEDPQVQLDLGAMGKASYLIGEEVGAGTRMKLVVNMVMGSMLTSLGEGLRLCDGAGLDQSQLVEVLGLGAMANPMFNLKGPNMAKNQHPTNFPLKHATKDMRLAMGLAQELGLHSNIPVSVAATAEFDRALALGYGDDDFSAVTEQAPKA